MLVNFPGERHVLDFVTDWSHLSLFKRDFSHELAAEIELPRTLRIFKPQAKIRSVVRLFRCHSR